MKSHGWLLAISFIPFTIFGFLFAQISNHGMNEPNLTPPIVTILDPSSQLNILFISVDTDAKPNPRLVSIWGLFFSAKSQNVAVFIPLYPSKDLLKDTVLLSEFFLIEGKHLDENFLQLTEQAFRVEWDVFVLINQKEVIKLTKQMDIDHATSDLEISSIPSNAIEVGLLTQLCSLLQLPEMDLDLRQILKTQVMDHNLPVSTLSSFAQWMDSGQPFSSCEVQQ
jgi:hypothetical protein